MDSSLDVCNRDLGFSCKTIIYIMVSISFCMCVLNVTDNLKLQWECVIISYYFIHDIHTHHFLYLLHMRGCLVLVQRFVCSCWFEFLFFLFNKNLSFLIASLQSLETLVITNIEKSITQTGHNFHLPLEERSIISC